MGDLALGVGSDKRRTPTPRRTVNGQDVTRTKAGLRTSEDPVG